MIVARSVVTTRKSVSMRSSRGVILRPLRLAQGRHAPFGFEPQGRRQGRQGSGRLGGRLCRWRQSLRLEQAQGGQEVYFGLVVADDGVGVSEPRGVEFVLGLQNVEEEHRAGFEI